MTIKCMVVDDDNTCNFMLRTLFSRYGECDTIASGFAAINAYTAALDKGNPYTFIILDIMMPDINGDEVIRNIRAIESKREIPLKELIALYYWHCRHHTAHITSLRKRMKW